MTRRLLSGNEAIALGAFEAGCAVGCGYPGTPSTEIIEALHPYEGVYTEWSVNEKVALEVGLGACYAGGRALVTMKHVGVNVAADPLFTASYTGVNAGLVVVTADDPSMHSSQNEQDNRHYAVAAKLPMFEPSDSAEARAFTRAAFELSETFDTPVFLRTTTRLSHSKGIVDADDAAAPAKHPVGFARDATKYVMIPAHARRRRVAVERRMDALAAAVETHPANRVEHAGPEPARVGVITSGVPYTYLKEVLPDADVLKLGIVHPLPRTLISEFVANHDVTYVVEDSTRSSRRRCARGGSTSTARTSSRPSASSPPRCCALRSPCPTRPARRPPSPCPRDRRACAPAARTARCSTPSKPRACSCRATSGATRSASCRPIT